MSMNRASVESYINGTLTQPVPPWVDTDILNQKHSAFVKAGDTVQAIGLDEKKITADPTMTDAGKMPKFKALADQSVPKFAPLGRMIGDADATIDRLTNILIGPITAIPKDVNEIVDFLSMQEERQGIGRAGAALAFLRSLETGNTQTARALLSAPGQPWIPADIRARGEEEYARRTNPDAYAKRKSVGFLKDHLTALAEMIRQWLVGLGADKELVAKTLHLK